MTSNRGYWTLLVLAIAVGMVLQLSSLRGLGVFDVGTIFLFVWGMAPYLALLAVPRLTRGRAEVIAVVLATVIPDLVLRLDVESSTSSTAPIALIFIPFWILVLFMPVALYGVRVVVWLKGRIHG
jgi:hypothetical protein